LNNEQVEGYPNEGFGGNGKPQSTSYILYKHRYRDNETDQQDIKGWFVVTKENGTNGEWQQGDEVEFHQNADNPDEDANNTSDVDVSGFAF
jgi:hypothetical protein